MGEPENLDFLLGPLGTLICGFEYTKLLLKLQEAQEICFAHVLKK